MGGRVKRVKKNGGGKSKAADAVYDCLYKKIIDNDLKEGDFLPVQDSLAERFNVSRSSIRDALTRLSAIGMVETVQGSGTRVLGAPRNYLPDVKDLLDNPSSVSDFMETRFYLECGAVSLATIRGKKEDFDRLSLTAEMHIEAAKEQQVDRAMELEMAFHQELSEMGSNIVLSQIFHTVRNTLSRFLVKINAVQKPSVHFAKEHLEIVRAMEARDSKRAVNLMCKHLLASTRKTEQLMDCRLGLEAYLQGVHDSRP